MIDPTNSRYRYLDFKATGSYRRFTSEENNIEQAAFVNHDQTTPAHGTYGAVLFDPRWKAKRQEILKKDAYRCVVCQGKDGLQVHHRQYHFIVRQNQFKLPWDYPSNLLITLCEICHRKGHNKFKVPTINI